MACVVFLALVIGPLIGNATLTGNDKEAVVQIEAPPDGCWTAAVGNASHDGCGSQSIPVRDDLGMFSSNVQKKDEGGWTLTISIVQDGETLESNSTSAAFGIAQVIAS